MKKIDQLTTRMDLIKPIVLFGNGDIPSHVVVSDKLQEAKSFICLDGGADKLISLGFKPNVILGDLDSIQEDKNNYACPVISQKDQSKNDLEKSLQWCLGKKINELTLVGFSGGRDDQYFVTMQIIREFSQKIKLITYTDTSVIYCIKKHTVIPSSVGQNISIIPFHTKTRIKTIGLKFPLEFSELSSPSHGISNITLESSFSIDSDDWVLVFLNHV